jgi:tetraacyldisaccharide 4'-kinase
MSIESFIIDVIEEKRRAPFLKGALYFFSLIFGLVSRIRHFLYDIHVLKSIRLNKPVVSVGNLVAGGTGKTPFTARLLEEIPGKNAVLTRGYLSQKKTEPLLVTEKTSPIFAGDEPLWLAQKTSASIWSCKNRVESGRLAVSQGAECLFLEDGFQHRRLARDVEIVLLDGLDLFGKKYFLPRGYLRDDPSRLKKADWVIITRVEEGIDQEKTLQEVRKFTNAPVIGFGAKYQIEKSLKGEKAGAFCGIAKPAIFYRALKREGIDVISSLSSGDHVLPSLEDLKSFALKCQREGAKSLICTEKDMIKLPKDLRLSLPVFSLRMELDCLWNENSWKEMCQSIKNRK